MAADNTLRVAAAVSSRGLNDPTVTERMHRGRGSMPGRGLAVAPFTGKPRMLGGPIDG